MMGCVFSVFEPGITQILSGGLKLTFTFLTFIVNEVNHNYNFYPLVTGRFALLKEACMGII